MTVTSKFVTEPLTPEQEASLDGQVDYIRTGPGTLCGTYLRKFWQPIMVGSKLEAGRSRALTIMGQKLAVYRSQEGVAHCVDNRCAHRGAMLTGGWVEGDTIRCPYHGWAFGAGGQCVDQPFENEGYKKNIWIGGYPTREYLGLIFVYLGEGDPPEFPIYPEWDNADLVMPLTEIRHCNWFQNVENFQDETHVWFTHLRSALTSLNLAEYPKVTCEKTPWGLSHVSVTPDGRRRSTLFGMPNIGMFTVPPGNLTVEQVNDYEDEWEVFLSWRVPVDDESHMQVHAVKISLMKPADEEYLKLWERLGTEEIDERARFYAQQVRDGILPMDELANLDLNVPVAQDDVVQLGQGVYPNRTRGVENLGAGDNGVIAIRRLYEQELTAHAEGRALQEWERPEGLLPETGE